MISSTTPTTTTRKQKTKAKTQLDQKSSSSLFEKEQVQYYERLLYAAKKRSFSSFEGFGLVG
jgi:hypothetical protein